MAHVQMNVVVLLLLALFCFRPVKGLKTKYSLAVARREQTKYICLSMFSELYEIKTSERSTKEEYKAPVLVFYFVFVCLFLKTR